MQFRCLCLCHDTEIDIHTAGVFTDDPIEAAVACAACRNGHVRALLVSRESLGLPSKRGPRVVKPVDPRSWEQKYADYLREQQKEQQRENDGC